MTVDQLISILTDLSAEGKGDCVLFVSRGSEERELLPEDLMPDYGRVETADGKYDGPFVLVTTWS